MNPIICVRRSSTKWVHLDIGHWAECTHHVRGPSKPLSTLRPGRASRTSVTYRTTAELPTGTEYQTALGLDHKITLPSIFLYLLSNFRLQKPWSRNIPYFPVSSLKSQSLRQVHSVRPSIRDPRGIESMRVSAVRCHSREEQINADDTVDASW